MTPLVLIDCKTFLMQRYLDKKPEGPTVTVSHCDVGVLPKDLIEEYRLNGMPA